jgi:hypothetical protein
MVLGREKARVQKSPVLCTPPSAIHGRRISSGSSALTKSRTVPSRSKQDVDNAIKIWGKNIAALKGKTTRNKLKPVTEDFVKVPTVLL